MTRIGRPPRTTWPQRALNWANTYALNLILAVVIIASYAVS